MRIILLLAAIYSLIINQCCKTASQSLVSSKREERIAGIGVLFGSVYHQHRPAFKVDFAAAAYYTGALTPGGKKQVVGK